MLHLHAAGDIRTLARRLAGVLSAAPADPMQREFVAVPSAGMRTWLSLELARHLGSRMDPAGSELGDGVSANIELPFPGALRLRLLEAEGSLEADTDPWDVDRLPWTILEVADSGADSGKTGRIPALLLEAPPGGSRWSAARRVADLFDRYHLHRPAMIEAWATGRDVDGIGEPLDQHHLWQAELWRSLRALLEVPSPPERMAALLPRLRAGELEVDLPERVCVFGMSLLPGGPGFVDLADALGSSRDVHLFVVQPSAVLARRFSAQVSGGRPARAAGTVGHRLRKEVDPAALHHPLLRSWGRMHYETASVLVDARASGCFVEPADTPAAAATEASDPEGGDGNLLALLRARIRDDVASVGELDRSHPALGTTCGRIHGIEFHACHGRTRQVEVMRDSILRLLGEHPDLEEEDVLVVCPDLEGFAPLIEAALGPSAHTGEQVDRGDATPRLRYRLADRSLGATVPLVSAFTALLELVSGRFDAPSVLDFLALGPVRRRFGFDDEELATITQWVLGVNVRWGLDAESRKPYGVPGSITTNTWQAGVDRILMGSSVSDPSAGTSGAAVVDTLGSVVPHGVEGSQTGIAGRLADVLWRLGDLAAEVRTERPVGEWVSLLGDVALRLFSVEPAQQWQRDRVLRTLGEVVDSSERLRDGRVVPSETLLDFDDIRRVVDDRLGAVQGRPSFMRGGVTISSLTPLRWVPHRVIVMLGMDAEVLTSGTTDGDDLAAAEPLVGDRDRRGELRQSMLETVLSAGDHLVLIRNGHDVRTNQPVPMPVAVAELRDAVVGMLDPGLREELLSTIEVEHPRQPFDEAYFVESGADNGVLDGSPAVPARSFDQRALAGARSRRERAPEPPAFLDQPLEAAPIEAVTLGDLHRFLRNPIRHFVERRLEMRLPRKEDVPTGTLPVSVGGLDTYELGAQLLEMVSADGDTDAAVSSWCDLAVRTGTVPVGAAGDLHLRRIQLEVLELAEQARIAGMRLGERAPLLPVDLEVQGVRIVGAVGNALDGRGGDSGGPALARFVRRRPEHLLSMWLDLAIVTLAYPDRGWRGVVATRDERGGKHKVQGVADVGRVEVSGIRLSSADPLAAAADALEVVVDLYRRGAREPLPLFRKLSAATFADPGRLSWPDQYADDAEMLVYGRLSASELSGLPVREGDPPGDAQDRLNRYAQYLYGTLESSTEPVPGEEP
jgi:exodeoxyribonuclease V gamma subunit